MVEEISSLAVDAGRAVLSYLFLLLVFRVAGRRSLAELTTFDLVVVFLISAAARPLLLRQGAGVASGIVLVGALVATHWSLSWAKTRSKGLARLLDGRPTLLWADGKPRESSMRAEKVDRDDILHAARSRHGLSSLEQVDRAYLEVDGTISVVPRVPTRSRT